MTFFKFKLALVTILFSFVSSDIVSNSENKGDLSGILLLLYRKDTSEIFPIQKELSSDDIRSIFKCLSTIGNRNTSLAPIDDLPNVTNTTRDGKSVSETNLLQSYQVVRVQSKLNFTSGKLINLDDKKCTLKDGKTRVACFPLSSCIKFDASTSNTDDVIDVNVEYLLDSNKTEHHRLFFLNYEGANTMQSTVRIRNGVELCTNMQVYIGKQIRDKRTAMKAEIRYVFIETSNLAAPVINLSSTAEGDSVFFRYDCGSDNVCEPDLQLFVTSSHQEFPVGSAENFSIEVKVYNDGDPSFESMVFIQFPEGLVFSQMYPIEYLGTNRSALCSVSSISTNNAIACDIGNPLPSFSGIKFRLFFLHGRGGETNNAYIFYIRVNSSNPESRYHMNDNMVQITISKTVETELRISGSSNPPALSYNASHYGGHTKVQGSEIGPIMMHTYEVICFGPSMIKAAVVTIFWPSYTADGSHLLYLVELNHNGSATCEPNNAIDPLKIRDTRFKRHSTDKTLHEGKGLRRRFNSTHKTYGGRQRRHVEFVNSTEEGTQHLPVQMEGTVPCGNFKCARINCLIGPLRRYQRVYFSLRGRIYADTLKEKYAGQRVELSSKMTVRVTALPHGVSPDIIEPKELSLVTAAEEEIKSG